MSFIEGLKDTVKSATEQVGEVLDSTGHKAGQAEAMKEYIFGANADPRDAAEKMEQKFEYVEASSTLESLDRSAQALDHSAQALQGSAYDANRPFVETKVCIILSSWLAHIW
ncbi:unnamed protein product [Strongylus vulgaris]|uniref:BAR domain-containing protein n=1 Tax=Strongylus vulgaris TaxID=40348 RepID=A0A3P7JG95_STRVU|nr:unnamed protein product [Strongylus vulgaris]